MRPRIIPSLLLHDGALVKTKMFRSARYLGDPINAVKIFNDKEVDELILVDMDATTDRRGPNLELIEDICSEAFMPISYSGGIQSVAQMREVYSAGVEKVSISSAALANTSIVTQASNVFGRQSVVVTIDVMRQRFRGRYDVVVMNGRKKIKGNLLELVKEIELCGAGELLVNNATRDGTRRGYDRQLMKSVAEVVNLPVLAQGGAASIEDMVETIRFTGVSGAVAGSVFAFHGKLDAVLPNYPTQNELDRYFGDE